MTVFNSTLRLVPERRREEREAVVERHHQKPLDALLPAELLIIILFLGHLWGSSRWIGELIIGKWGRKLTVPPLPLSTGNPLPLTTPRLEVYEICLPVNHLPPPSHPLRKGYSTQGGEEHTLASPSSVPLPSGPYYSLHKPYHALTRSSFARQRKQK